MKVSDIMTPSIVVIDFDSTIRNAAKKMRDLDVGFLAVIQDKDIHGLITDRDIVIRGLASEIDFDSIKVSEIMTENPVVCDADADIEKAADLFAIHQIRRLIVIDKDGSPIGVVSLGDLAVELNDNEMIGNVLKQVKKGISVHDDIPQSISGEKAEEISGSVS